MNGRPLARRPKRGSKRRRNGGRTAYIMVCGRLPWAMGGAAAKEIICMAKPKRGVVGRILGPGKYIIGLAVVAAAAWYWFGSGDVNGGKPVYRFAKIELGTIANTVTASGTLKAIITVDVGTQISGQIKQLFADFNTEVKANQVIARIDPATFEAKVREAEADLATAKGNVSLME